MGLKKKRTTIYLETELRDKVKIYCIKYKTNVTQLIIKKLKETLGIIEAEQKDENISIQEEKQI